MSYESGTQVKVQGLLPTGYITLAFNHLCWNKLANKKLSALMSPTDYHFNAHSRHISIFNVLSPQRKAGVCTGSTPSTHGVIPVFTMR